MSCKLMVTDLDREPNLQIVDAIAGHDPTTPSTGTDCKGLAWDRMALSPHISWYVKYCSAFKQLG